MTEKRFAMDYGDEYHQKRIIQRCNGNTFILPHSTVVDFLNELYGENEQLKKEVKRLKCINKQLEDRLDRDIALNMNCGDGE